METIYINKTEKGFVVQHGNRTARDVSIKDAIGIVFSLLTQEDPNWKETCEVRLMTREQQANHDNYMKSLLDRAKEGKICGRCTN